MVKFSDSDTATLIAHCPPLSPHKAITTRSTADAMSGNMFSFDIYTLQHPPPSPTNKQLFCMVEVDMHEWNGKQSKIVK